MFPFLHRCHRPLKTLKQFLQISQAKLGGGKVREECAEHTVENLSRKRKDTCADTTQNVVQHHHSKKSTAR